MAEKSTAIKTAETVQNVSEDIKKIVIENWIVIAIALIVAALMYINMKVNDLDYRLIQLMINNDSPLKRRSYRDRNYYR
jgi:hypothetical protein